jgi:hypothetical protein
MKIRFTIVLPAIYLIVAAYFAAGCIWEIGHGTGCQNLYRAGIPTVFLFPKNLSFGIVWAFAAGLAQYLLVGFVVDRFLDKKR